MAEVSRQSGGKESPAGEPCNFRRVDPTAVRISISDGSMDSPTERCSSADISLKMNDACRTPPPSNPKIQIQTSLSHKGWFLGEEKVQQQDDGWSKSHKGSRLDHKCHSVVVPISAIEVSCQQSVVGELKTKKSRLPWLDSRKVFMIFASLSSMGTIMLIYLTLSIGRIDGHHARD